MRYHPPGGTLGKRVARLFAAAPEQQVFDDLRHLKQVMETGQVVLSDGSLDGSRLAQLLHEPQAAAHFERTGRQMVLVLDPHLAATARGQQRPDQLGRRQQFGIDFLRGARKVCGA